VASSIRIEPGHRPRLQSDCPRDDEAGKFANPQMLANLQWPGSNARAEIARRQRIDTPVVPVPCRLMQADGKLMGSNINITPSPVLQSRTSERIAAARTIPSSTKP